MWSSLIRYLTTCRHCMLGRLETEHDSSEGELQLLDTMLILCYLQSGNVLVDNFVRLRNYADIAETETMPKQHLGRCQGLPPCFPFCFLVCKVSAQAGSAFCLVFVLTYLKRASPRWWISTMASASFWHKRILLDTEGFLFPSPR